MKKIRIRTLSLMLLVSLLFTSVMTGCSGVNTKAVVEYEGGEISSAIFQYLCCLKKTEYLYEAYGVDSSTVSSSQLEDNAAIWVAKAADGSTVADTLKSEVLDDIKLLLYMKQYAESKGYTLGTDEKKTIKSEFDKMVSNFGDKKTFNQEMKQYGIDYDQMLEYNYIQTLAYQGMELLFGENGSMKISSDSAEKYYKNNYATTACIFINTQNKTYPNGKVVVLPEEEKQEKLKLADEVFAKVQAGEDFAALALAHSDQTVDEGSAKAGYTFSKGGFVNSSAEEKVWEMKTGEVARVDTDGGVYILCRKSLDMNYFETAKESITAELEEVKKFSLVSGVEDKFELDSDFLNELDIASLPHVV